MEPIRRGIVLYWVNQISATVVKVYDPQSEKKQKYTHEGRIWWDNVTGELSHRN